MCVRGKWEVGSGKREKRTSRAGAPHEDDMKAGDNVNREGNHIINLPLILQWCTMCSRCEEECGKVMG